VSTFALASTVLGAAAHVWCGGAAPTVWLSLLLVAVLGVLWHQISPRELSFGRLVAAVWSSQVAVHVALLTGDGSTVSHPSVHRWIGAGAVLSAVLMVVGHALAGLAVAGCLRWAEVGLWRLFRRVCPVLPGAPVPVLVGRSAHARARGRQPFRNVGFLRRPLLRRGPPALACAR
jgi:hypothetical protein